MPKWRSRRRSPAGSSTSTPRLVSGGRVRRGQTLVRIEQADYENDVQQARADVQQQQVSVLQAEEEVQIAREEYRRFQERQQRRDGSRFAGIDDDDYAARVAEGNGSSAGAGAGTPTTQAARDDTSGGPRLVFREPQLEAARAAQDRAQAQLEDARLALERTTIEAPFDAVVRSEDVDEGSYIAPGQTIAQLYAADAVEVVVPLSNDEAALIPNLWALDAGRSDDVRIPALVYADYGASRYRWEGYVDRAEAALDEATRTIDLVIRVERPFEGGEVVGLPEERGDGPELSPVTAPPLLVGTFAEVAVEGATLDRYFVIPRPALRRGDEVYAVRQDSLVEIVPIQLLQQHESDLYVRGNLEAGQPVITSDLQAVTDGDEGAPGPERHGLVSRRQRADVRRAGVELFRVPCSMGFAVLPASAAWNQTVTLLPIRAGSAWPLRREIG